MIVVWLYVLTDTLHETTCHYILSLASNQIILILLGQTLFAPSIKGTRPQGHGKRICLFSQNPITTLAFLEELTFESLTWLTFKLSINIFTRMRLSECPRWDYESFHTQILGQGKVMEETQRQNFFPSGPGKICRNWLQGPRTCCSTNFFRLLGLSWFCIHMVMTGNCQQNLGCHKETGNQELFGLVWQERIYYLSQTKKA